MAVMLYIGQRAARHLQRDTEVPPYSAGLRECPETALGRPAVSLYSGGLQVGRRWLKLVGQDWTL